MHETQGHHTIQINELTRVEGQGALYVRIQDGRVAETRFKIFEPPRFFEAFLRGRDFREVPDITSRICGICPVAYQMSSAHALEKIMGALPAHGGAIHELRRLFYCGEWIESHSLHAFFLHLPDYLGLSGVIGIAETNPDLVERAIRIRKAGNAIVTALGGRPMHPVGARVGGWHRAPTRAELNALVPLLEAALEDSLSAAAWLKANLTVPAFESDYEFIALRHGEEYPFNAGRITSSRGWDCPMDEWEERFEETQVEHSNACQARVRETGSSYHCGPMARFNLNFETLGQGARDLARSIGVEPPVVNPYQSIFVRLIEIVLCFEESLRIIDRYERPGVASVPFEVRAGEAAWATEAPRGMLFHRYRIDAAGEVESARIIPPTSQNQARIEEDLRRLIEARMDELDDHDLSHACEFMIRNYDPCISCATHFLAFKADRRENTHETGSNAHDH